MSNVLTYRELLVPKGKTWREALQHYGTIFKLDLSKYISIDDNAREYYKVQANEPFILENLGVPELENKYLQNEAVTSQLLKDIEQEYELQFPDQLVDLYVNHGSFSINGDHGFTVFKPDKNEYFIDEFGNYGFSSEFVWEAECLTEEQYEEVSERFFFWGIGFYENDGGNAVMYFYDNEVKRFGEIFLLMDDCPKMEKKYFPALLAGELSCDTLDELILRQINRLLLSQIMFNDEHALMKGKDLDERDKDLFDGDLLRIYDF